MGIYCLYTYNAYFYWFFVKFGGNLFFISPVFFFLNPIKSCRYDLLHCNS